MAAAQTEVDRSAEALQIARQSVGAFEGELTVRAGEDVQRMKRFAAAEQLRAQIDAVAGTLRQPRRTPARTVEAVDQEVVAAESTFDQAASEISDLARRARKLAEELPIDQRPKVTRSAPSELAESLRGARRGAPARDRQGRSRRGDTRRAARGGPGRLPAGGTVTTAPSRGPDGRPRPAARRAPDEVLVLDEPFVGLDDDVRADLLEIVRTAPPIGRSSCSPRMPRSSAGPSSSRSRKPPPSRPMPCSRRLRRSNHGLNLSAGGRCHPVPTARSDRPHPRLRSDGCRHQPPPIDTDQKRRPPAAGPGQR